MLCTCSMPHLIMAIIFTLWSLSLYPFSNDSFEGEPEEKRRKTTNVVIDQPATEHKVLIDNVPDNSSLSEEVKCQPIQWLIGASDEQLIAINGNCWWGDWFLIALSLDTRVASGELLWGALQWPLQSFVGGKNIALFSPMMLNFSWEWAKKIFSNKILLDQCEQANLDCMRLLTGSSWCWHRS